MKNLLQEVVRDFFKEDVTLYGQSNTSDSRIRTYLLSGWDATKILDQSRFAVETRCLAAGVDCNDVAIANMILRCQDDMPKEDWFIPVPPRPSFVLDVGETRNVFRYVSRYADFKVTQPQHDMMDNQTSVVHVYDEELVDTTDQVYRLLAADERESFMPKHCYNFARRMAGKEFQIPYGSVDAAGRVYPLDQARASAQGCKAARAFTVRPDPVLTKLSDQEAYMKLLGIDKDPSEVIADPVLYISTFSDYQEGLFNYAQCMSWYRISKTLRKNGFGFTNILTEWDQAVSGYAHLLAKLRKRKLLEVATPLLPGFKDPRHGIARVLQGKCNELKHLPALDGGLVGLAKSVFTPVIYDSGQGGLFNNFTKKNTVEGLLTKKEFKGVPLPEVLEIVWMPHFVDTEGKVDHKGLANKLFDFCGTAKKAAMQECPQLRSFSEAMHEAWNDRATELGLEILQSDGTVVLCPRQRRQPQGAATREYSAKWRNPQNLKQLQKVSCTIRAPRLDDEGTGVMAFSCHNDDATTMRGTVLEALESNGVPMVRQQVFDAVMCSLANVKSVQGKFTKNFNATHSKDRLNTGRKQVIVTGPMLRP